MYFSLLFTALVSSQFCISHAALPSPAEEYDFIVVGGGTAGLTVAHRLSMDPSVTVLVVEHGPLTPLPPKDPAIWIPGLLDRVTYDGLPKDYWFNITSTPQQHLAGRTNRVWVPHLVGGGTMINGQISDRGGRDEYDAWAELIQDESWKWDNLVKYFMKNENFTPPDPAYAKEWGIHWDPLVHGEGGPVQQSFPVFQYPSVKNWFRSWMNLNISTLNDPMSGVKAGAFWASDSIDPSNETRSSARSAMFDRFDQIRPNYKLLDNTAVTKILFSRDSTSAPFNVTGVELVSSVSQTGKRSISARKEVIVAAGAINSPKLLQLSGIGPKFLLDPLGIDTVKDLPVGFNFQDHATLSTKWNYSQPIRPLQDDLNTNQSFIAQSMADYYYFRKGPYTIAGATTSFTPLPNMTALVAHKSIQALTSNISPIDAYSRHDIPQTVKQGYMQQLRLINAEYKNITTGVVEIRSSGGTGISVTLVKPLSRGTLRLNSTDAFAPPMLDLNGLALDSDIAIMTAGLRLQRLTMAVPGMSEMGPSEVAPGAQYKTDEQIEQFIRTNASATYGHSCCSCPMMPADLGGIVDSQLKVYGVQGLRVVDASVMPMIVAAHTASTVYAIAEKAADMIKADWKLAAS